MPRARDDPYVSYIPGFERTASLYDPDHPEPRGRVRVRFGRKEARKVGKGPDL